MNYILQDDPLFQKLNPIHQQRLSMLLNSIMNGDFRHKQIIPINEIDSISLSSEYMRKLFRKKYDGSYYKVILDQFFECVNESYHFGYGKGMTRKFKAQNRVAESYLKYYKDSTPFTITHFEKKSQTPITSIPKNAVCDLDISGNEKASRVILPSTIAVNVHAIESAINDLENASSLQVRNSLRMRNLIHLYQWRKAVNNTLAPNLAVQQYQESLNGRLSSRSHVNFPSIINTPNRIRKVLFSDMDMYDYDMSNSHFSIFFNLCKQYDFECPNLKYYLENKKALRSEWSDKYYLRVKVLKRYIISWLYGTKKNNVGKWNWAYESIGEDRLKGIKDDELLSGIYNEIVKGRNLIVKRHRENGVVTNIMGKERKVKSLSKDLCFILFGYESKIMEIVNQIIGDDMKVLIYDGWIGNKIDVSFLESEVERELGLAVKFDEELIESPSIFSLK